MEYDRSEQSAGRKGRKVYKIWAYAYMPILYILIAAGLLFSLAMPYLEPLQDVVKMISSEHAPDTTTLKTIFTGPPETQPPESTTEETAFLGETVSNTDVAVPYFNTEYAHLRCERLEIDCPVYFGDSDTALANGAGQYAGSWMPGYGGMILIAGHNYSVFYNLQDAEIGDRFQLDTNYGAFEYEVSDIQVHDKNDDSAYDFENLGHEQLVLYTCWPKNRMAGVKLERIYVYCEKISGPTVVGMRDGE